MLSTTELLETNDICKKQHALIFQIEQFAILNLILNCVSKNTLCSNLRVT